jgi:N,N'-diacetyllegionaminate synthase
MNYFSNLNRVLIVAEIGVNHNGDMSLAKQLIDAAKNSGADAVKFQTFTADALTLPHTPKVPYQCTTTSARETHFEMLRRLELNESQQNEIVDYCQMRQIECFSTPYDILSAKFLSKLGTPMFKTASADIVDLPLQRYIAATQLPAMVATGMSTLGEIERIVKIFEEEKNPNLILLHCVSNYPCSDESLNLRAMAAMGRAFSLPFGFSDHSEGYIAAVASVALGCKVIEKHFTLDRRLSGPDHKASSEPSEFADLVCNVRRVEQILGSARKECQPEERQMALVSRKSLTLNRTLLAGELLSADYLDLKRPGTGLDSSWLPSLLGLKVLKDLPVGHQIRWTDFGDVN